MATETHPESSTLALLRTLITALEDKKADQLKVLHVGGISDITDYLVLATGNSEPHLRALRIEAEKVLDAAKVKIAGMEQGGFNSGWTVVDAYQIMVHFFTAEQREAYSLEKLWKDAPEVDLKTLEAKPTAAAPKKRAAAKPKAKAPAKKTTGKTSAKKAPARSGKTTGKTKAPAKAKAPTKAKSAPAKRGTTKPKKPAK